MQFLGHFSKLEHLLMLFRLMFKMSVLPTHACLTALFNYYIVLGGQIDQIFAKLQHPPEYLAVRSTKHAEYPTLCCLFPGNLPCRKRSRTYSANYSMLTFS